MSERWPTAMRRGTAAEYLDVSVTQFDKLKIPPIQLLNERSERMWAKEDLDAYVEMRRRARIGA